MHGIHQAAQRDAEQQFSGYKEVGEIEVIDVAFDRAARIEFPEVATKPSETPEEAVQRFYSALAASAVLGWAR